MYRISVENEFSSAHLLRGYEGKCSSVHGHNWRVRLTVRAAEIDARGMGIDFGLLKKLLARIIERFDHVNLNEVEPFDRINPTAENLARSIYELIAKELPAGVEADRVELWESSKNRVEYSRE